MRAALPDQRGEKNRNWRKQKRPNAQGYVTVMVQAGDEIGEAMLGTNRRKYGHTHILEHRLVMAHYLGRSLKSTEVVHHINGDRADNRIDNLALMPSRSAHARAIHYAECPHCGKPLR